VGLPAGEGVERQRGRRKTHHVLRRLVHLAEQADGILAILTGDLSQHLGNSVGNQVHAPEVPKITVVVRAQRIRVVLDAAHLHWVRQRTNVAQQRWVAHERDAGLVVKNSVVVPERMSDAGATLRLRAGVEARCHAVVPHP